MFNNLSNFLFGDNNDPSDEKIDEDGWLLVDETGAELGYVHGREIQQTEAASSNSNRDTSSNEDGAVGKQAASIANDELRAAIAAASIDLASDSCKKPDALSTKTTPSKCSSSSRSGSVRDLSDEAETRSEAGLSDVSSQPEVLTHPSLEENWLITPPQCFTQKNSENTVLASSPLENLFIEHPSMSVYSPNSLHVTNEVMINYESMMVPTVYGYYLTPPNSETSEDGESTVDNAAESTVDIAAADAEERVRHAQERGQVIVRPVERRDVVNMTASRDLVARREELKGLQREKRRKVSRQACKQSNKVQQYNSQCKIKRRKDHVMCPSGRSNNRKC